MAVSRMVKVAVRPPAAVGVNVTLIVQLVPAARLLPQLSVSAKSPFVAMLVISSAALPGLLRVTAWGSLVVPRACEVKLKLAGLTLAAAIATAPRL